MATKITVDEVTQNVTVTVSNERGPAGQNGGGSWGTITGTLSSQTDLQAALDLKAPLASPTFTGTVTADHIHGNLAGSVYMHIRAGEALSKGDPVYVSDSHGTGSAMVPIVMRADASNPAKMPAIAIMDAAVANNGSGHAVINGTISDLDTAAYSINSTLYVANGGGMTATKPANAQPVARVERSHTNNGGIVVKVNGLYSDILTSAGITAAMETSTEEQKETLVPDSINDLTASVIVPDNVQVVRNLYPLPIPMYSGDGRTNPGSGLIHPDVIVFDAPWNGFTHWMAVTPYPSGNNAFENPSIYASNDGIEWVVPAGLTNPLKAAPGGGGYNSDPLLVFASGTLHCIYRTTISDQNVYYIRSSTNGTTWTPEAVFLNDLETGGVNAVSPTIIHDGTQWVLYYRTSALIKRRTAPSVTGPWSAPTSATFIGTPDALYRPTSLSTRQLWHLQCFRHAGKTYMLAQIPASSAPFDFDDGRLHLAESSDGIAFKFSEKPIFASPLNLFSGSGSTDPNEWYYRSSIVPVLNQGKLLLRMWYSTERSNMGYAELEVQDQAKEPAFSKKSTIRILTGNSSPINNTATLVSNNILRVPLRAGVPTLVELSIGIDTSNTTTGARFNLIPTSANIDFFKGQWVAGGEGLASVIFGRQSASDINTTNLTALISGAVQNFHISGKFLIIARTNLDLAFAFAQGTANATNTVIRGGSWIEATEPTL